MNLTVYVIELLVVIVCFALMVMIAITINPVGCITDYPPEIQEEFYRSQKREKKNESTTKVLVIKKGGLSHLRSFYLSWRAHLAGVDTFLQVTLISFSYVVVIAAFDTFIIDCILFSRIKRWRLPGTENMDREYRKLLT